MASGGLILFNFPELIHYTVLENNNHEIHLLTIQIMAKIYLKMYSFIKDKAEKGKGGITETKGGKLHWNK